MDQEQKTLEYLKLIQPIVTRMNSSSTTIKGIAITVTVFLLGLSLKGSSYIENIVLFFIIIILHAFDMYYLWHERLYRELYNDVRENKLDSFNLTVVKYKKTIKYHDCIISVPTFIFYYSLSFFNILAAYYTAFAK